MRKHPFWARITFLCLAASPLALTAQNQHAIKLDGYSSYISLPTSTPVPTGNSSYTLEAWIKPDYMGTEGIIGWGNWGATNQVNALRLTSNGLVNYWWGNDLTVTTGDLSGYWHHVAVTFDGTTRTIYLDGSMRGSDQPGNGHAVPDAANLSIGVTNNSEYFPGLIDEVRVWNRALCQDELNNNISGRLPDPSMQGGLVAYYQFDQGTVYGNNSAVTAVIDSSSERNNGTLVGYYDSEYSNTWDWVDGNGNITGTANLYEYGSVYTEKDINGATAYGDCGTIATITPAGASPVSGTITVESFFDSYVQSVGYSSWVQRHIDITPANNPNTATANITLYFKQSDFDAYNGYNWGVPGLPTGPTDVTGISNLRVTQFHGTSGSHTPQSYNGYTGAGPKNVLITPTTVSWNSSMKRWEVTFPVTGFSGFFVTGRINGPLPLQWLSVNAALNSANKTRVQWQVEEKAVADYSIEKSSDGRNYTAIGRVVSKGDGKNSYSFTESLPLTGTAWYRILQTDVDGRTSYSAIMQVNAAAGAAVSVYPNPASRSISVTVPNALLNTQAVLVNAAGGRLQTVAVKAASFTVDVQSLQPGIYFLRFTNGTVLKFVKQ